MSRAPLERAALSAYCAVDHCEATTMSYRSERARERTCSIDFLDQFRSIFRWPMGRRNHDFAQSLPSVPWSSEIVRGEYPTWWTTSSGTDSYVMASATTSTGPRR